MQSWSADSEKVIVLHSAVSQTIFALCPKPRRKNFLGLSCPPPHPPVHSNSFLYRFPTLNNLKTSAVKSVYKSVSKDFQETFLRPLNATVGDFQLWTFLRIFNYS
jgi:hypothetical protein